MIIRKLVGLYYVLIEMKYCVQDQSKERVLRSHHYLHKTNNKSK